jgi:hypothetical protein
MSALLPLHPPNSPRPGCWHRSCSPLGRMRRILGSTSPPRCSGSAKEKVLTPLNPRAKKNLLGCGTARSKLNSCGFCIEPWTALWSTTRQGGRVLLLTTSALSVLHAAGWMVSSSCIFSFLRLKPKQLTLTVTCSFETILTTISGFHSPSVSTAHNA